MGSISCQQISLSIPKTQQPLLSPALQSLTCLLVEYHSSLRKGCQTGGRQVPYCFWMFLFTFSSFSMWLREGSYNGSIATKSLNPRGFQAPPGRGRCGDMWATPVQILHVPGTLSQGLVTSDRGARGGPSPESHWTTSCPWGWNTEPSCWGLLLSYM